jgi:hypothetical protein
MTFEDRRNYGLKTERIKRAIDRGLSYKPLTAPAEYDVNHSFKKRVAFCLKKNCLEKKGRCTAMDVATELLFQQPELELDRIFREVRKLLNKCYYQGEINISDGYRRHYIFPVD